MTKKELFEKFQQCFGRFLTPFEIEDIQKWIDEEGMSVEVVNLALKEAVYNEKINMKYINRVLRDWGKAGVNTVEKVEQRLETFERNRSRKPQGQSNYFGPQGTGY